MCCVVFKMSTELCHSMFGLVTGGTNNTNDVPVSVSQHAQLSVCNQSY